MHFKTPSKSTVNTKWIEYCCAKIKTKNEIKLNANAYLFKLIYFHFFFKGFFFFYKCWDVNVFFLSSTVQMVELAILTLKINYYNVKMSTRKVFITSEVVFENISTNRQTRERENENEMKIKCEIIWNCNNFAINRDYCFDFWFCTVFNDQYFCCLYS